MCGFSGVFLSEPVWDSEVFQATLKKMTQVLNHRGPDSSNVWFDREKGIGLGHCRLAIRDLSPSGNQPMISSCKRFVIVYNGEIYSHAEIASELAGRGRDIKGSSDTEVVLEACAEWGVEHAVKKLIGMFAFALYDRKDHVLYLVRDRLGIKPLYWGAIDKKIVFGSELKSLRQIPGWQPRVDRGAVSSFMRHNYIPTPLSIYQDIQKLTPGTMLKITGDGNVTEIRYWDLISIAAENISNRTDVDENQMLCELDELLSDSVRRRLVSDVSLGTLLSGGIDSSLVTALLTEQSDKQVHTFTIGFNEDDFNEAKYAKLIAEHLNTKHTELYAEPEQAAELISRIPQYYDEPFADSSQLPTMLLSELTRSHVKVVLSGDGGDELFAGYNRYTDGLRMWSQATTAPYFIRKQLSRFLLSGSTSLWDNVTRCLPSALRRPQMGIKIHKYANAILTSDPDSMYMRMISHWDPPDDVVIGAKEYKGILWDESIKTSFPNFLDRMQLLDTLTYLPDDILTKVDRASMSVSLETRVPLLDHRLVEFAWRLPIQMKLRNGQGKWALRQLLYKRVPRHLIERPKMGFGVPFDQWIRGPLKDWAESLLNKKRLDEQGLLVSAPIIDKWQRHLGGENWGYPLWNVLMLQAWLDNNPDVAI